MGHRFGFLLGAAFAVSLNLATAEARARDAGGTAHAGAQGGGRKGQAGGGVRSTSQVREAHAQALRDRIDGIERGQVRQSRREADQIAGGRFEALARNEAAKGRAERRERDLADRLAGLFGRADEVTISGPLEASGAAGRGVVPHAPEVRKERAESVGDRLAGIQRKEIGIQQRERRVLDGNHFTAFDNLQRREDRLGAQRDHLVGLLQRLAGPDGGSASAGRRDGVRDGGVRGGNDPRAGDGGDAVGGNGGIGGSIVVRNVRNATITIGDAGDGGDGGTVIGGPAGGAASAEGARAL